MEKNIATVNGESSAVGDDAITILENDHRRIKSLLGTLAEGSEEDQQKALEQLKELVTVHNATEENLVYPAIHDLAGRPMHASRLYHEQDSAKVIVWQLSMLSPGEPEFQTKANKLRDAVLEHIADEEEREFPRLREAAGDKMRKLSDDVRQFRAKFHA